MTEPKSSLSYRDAGVDIDAGNELVERIKPIVRRTLRPEVMGNLGGFGAMCKIPERYRNPVLVSGTDGVGTKLKIAIDSGVHGSVGIDLVAMCVNDLLAIGAEPLFFLDYFATGSLNVETATSVIDGIARGCELSGASLIGGETAEMPGMYQSGDYDLAGFCVGVVEESEVIRPENIGADHQLIALASSGVHSNGFSLVRKVLEVTGASFEDAFEDRTLGQALLEPTRIYVRPVLALARGKMVDGVAHITGGGLTENIPRVLPKGCAANINLDSFTLPPLFSWLQQKGNIATDEMLRTFNCGVGMVLAVPSAEIKEALETLKQHGEDAWVIGNVTKLSEGDEPVVKYTGVLS